jgi:hypothetical protein
MTEEELHAAEEQLELAVQQFDQAMHTVNGRVPAKTIDKWLDIHRRLQRFRSQMADEMRGP